MAFSLQQVQTKAMALKAKEVQAKIEQSVQFGQPLLMGATDDVTGEEGNDPVGMADGGLIGKAAASLGGRAKQLEEQEAKALAPPKEVKPMPKVEKKPEEKPRSFLETAKKAVFGFKDGGRVNCADGGLIRGPGTGTSDSVKAKGPNGEEIRLSDGEVVLPADTVQQLGVKNLEDVIDQTHTPVKQKFGNGFVNGLMLESPEEMAKRLAKPPVPEKYSPGIRMRPGAVAPAVAPPDPVLRTPGTGVRPVIGSAYVPPSAPPLEEQLARARPARLSAPAAPAAAAAEKVGFGQKLLNAGKAVLHPIDSAIGVGKALGGGALRLATGPVGQVVGGMLASGEAQAPTLGQGEQRIPDRVNALLVGRQKQSLIDELNNPNVTAARRAQITGFLTGSDGGETPNPATFGTITPPSTKPAAPSTQKQSTEVMGPEQPAPDPLKTWQAQALAGMGAGPGSGYQARPDLGAPGEQWMRKGNSYVGVGNGPQKGNGIDFGLPRMLAARAADASNFGYPEAPEFRENPAVTRLQGQIADAAERLNNIKPGELGGKSLARKLVGLQSAMAALQAPSTARSAFDEKRYENEVSKFGATQTARAQEATNQVARQTAKYNYDVERAKLGNEKHKQALAESQQRLGNENPRLEALAGEDKEMANSVKLFAGTRQFLGADGKPYSIWDLDPASKAAAYGILQQHVAKAKRLKDAKLPYSLADTDVETPAGAIGSIVSFVQHPIDTVKFGASTINDRLGTAAPRSYTTLEQVDAMKKQEKREQ